MIKTPDAIVSEFTLANANKTLPRLSAAAKKPHRQENSLFPLIMY